MIDHTDQRPPPSNQQTRGGPPPPMITHPRPLNRRTPGGPSETGMRTTGRHPLNRHTPGGPSETRMMTTRPRPFNQRTPGGPSETGMRTTRQRPSRPRRVQTNQRPRPRPVKINTDKLSLPIPQDVHRPPTPAYMGEFLTSTPRHGEKNLIKYAPQLNDVRFDSAVDKGSTCDKVFPKFNFFVLLSMFAFQKPLRPDKLDADICRRVPNSLLDKIKKAIHQWSDAQSRKQPPLLQLKYVEPLYRLWLAFKPTSQDRKILASIIGRREEWKNLFLGPLDDDLKESTAAEEYTWTHRDFEGLSKQIEELLSLYCKYPTRVCSQLCFRHFCI